MSHRGKRRANGLASNLIALNEPAVASIDRHAGGVTPGLPVFPQARDDFRSAGDHDPEIGHTEQNDANGKPFEHDIRRGA